VFRHALYFQETTREKKGQRRRRVDRGQRGEGDHKKTCQGKKIPSPRQEREGKGCVERLVRSLLSFKSPDNDASSSCTLHRPYLSPLVAPSGRQKKKYGVEQEKRNKRKVAHGTASSEFLFLCRHFQYLAAVAKTKPQKQTTYPRTIKSPLLRYVYSSSDSSSSSTVVLAIRSKSR
jgi:hypothetical protein